MKTVNTRIYPEDRAFIVSEARKRGLTSAKLLHEIIQDYRGRKRVGAPASPSDLTTTEVDK